MEDYFWIFCLCVFVCIFVWIFGCYVSYRVAEKEIYNEVITIYEYEETDIEELERDDMLDEVKVGNKINEIIRHINKGGKINE